LDAVLEACDQEGVASLVHARLSVMAPDCLVPSELLHALATRARLRAARCLLCVAEARSIQQALADAGIESIWLKGIALGHWLYPRVHLRDIADIDLLLPDHANTLRAAEVLAPLGYALPNPHVAGDLVVRELLAISDRNGLELDLHWDLSNGALFAARLSWPTLAADAIPLPALADGALGLSPIHAFLHACMHLAAGKLAWRQDRLRWLHDIHLLAAQFDQAGWDRVVREAANAQLADACAYALRSSCSVLGTAVSGSILDRLDAAARAEKIDTARLGHWRYFQWACWQRWPDLRTRLRWLRQLLFPDMAHLRRRYGADGAARSRIAARRIVDGVRRWWSYASGKAG